MESRLLEALLGQLVALGAFFAFPALQYILLRRFTQQEGLPQLWYLPSTGFRLVIRNLPGKRTLSGIRYRAMVRQVVPASGMDSSPTYVDDLIHERSDFFLFPGVDQVLLAFTLEVDGGERAWLVSRDLTGLERARWMLADFALVLCDYEATVENFFNFDVRLAKRVKISAERLKEIWMSVSKDERERRFAVTFIRNVG